MEQTPAVELLAIRITSFASPDVVEALQLIPVEQGQAQLLTPQAAVDGAGYVPGSDAGRRGGGQGAPKAHEEAERLHGCGGGAWA